MTISPVKILPEVVGKALYLEMSPVLDDEGKARVWQGADSIQQVVIIPNGKDSAGNDVKPTMLSRIVSPASPRSQWDTDQLHPIPNDAEILKELDDSENRYLSYKGIDKDEFEAYPDEIKRNLFANGISHKIRTLSLRSTSSWDEETKAYIRGYEEIWTLTKSFAVEVTDEDLGAVRSWKTPQAIIRRINKVKSLA